MNPAYAAMEAAFTVLIQIAIIQWVIWVPTLATDSNKDGDWGGWWFCFSGWGIALAVGFTAVALTLSWLISLCPFVIGV
jgi:hypothetical protein